jgi:hypothetical protein
MIKLTEKQTLKLLDDCTEITKHINDTEKDLMTLNEILSDYKAKRREIYDKLGLLSVKE